MYPTASAPQYAFGPGLAPVPMPGMAGGGLAALARQYRKGGRIKYFEEGGEGATGGADSSEQGGAGAAFGGGSSPGPDSGAGGPGGFGPGGADSSVEGGAGAGFGSSQTQSMAQAETQNQAITDALAAAALAGPLGTQIGTEAEEAQATKAAENMASLQSLANAQAAEIANQQEENAKAETMAAAMRGELAGFPGPQAQAAPGFGFSVQSPFDLKGKEAGLLNNPFVNDFVTFNTPIGSFGLNALGLAAPALGKGAQTVSGAVNAGKALSGMKEGGLAAAQQAQSAGRGQDTMLVHMTPGEVKGLQALAMAHGGSLTINPQTGLPEAGFLSAILPMVAGFALGPAGFQMMSSLQAGLTVGALTGVATGSLKKGLMAGLGAYGGAGIGEGLIGAGNVTAPVTTGTEAGLTSAADVATSNLSPVTTSTSGIDPSLLEGRGLTPNSPYFKMAQSNIDPGVLEGMGGTPGMTAQQVATAPVINPTPSVPTSPTVGFERTGEGFRNMFDTGQVGTDARSAFMKATPTGSLTAAGTTLASALTPEPAPLPTSKSYIRGYNLDITNPSGTPQYTPQDTREREQVRYAFSPRPIYEAAQGGTVDPDYNMEVDRNGGFSDAYKEGGLSALAKRRKALAGDKYYKFAQDRKDSSMEAAVEQNFAKGGMKDALPPRFLQGAGDGMSDSIKARIGGVQEARLADGEFVIPADVVSHLGNGSSKAGAKKLYSMMDKIRKARTGRTRQAPEVNPNKYMPA